MVLIYHNMTNSDPVAASRLDTPSETRRRPGDLELITRMVRVYCGKKHRARHDADGLCPTCRDMLAYAAARLARCPFDPKPACKHCKIHCWREPWRRRIRIVMRHAGLHLLFRSPLTAFRHFFPAKA